MKRTTTPLSEIKAKLADSILSPAKFVSDGVGTFYIPRGGWRNQSINGSPKSYDEYKEMINVEMKAPDQPYCIFISDKGEKTYFPAKPD